MKSKYLIRLDDACPTMDKNKWRRIFDILDQYKVRPMVGIIPHNEDPNQKLDEVDSAFWIKAKEWESKGYAIAQHGYNHCYVSDKGMSGLNPLWSRSEFAGLPYEEQCKKIETGYRILCEHGLNPKYFFAPSHTFDENTLKALEDCTDIRIISDTIASSPYRKGKIIFVPQVGGHCMEMKIPGIWTFCLHPSQMSDKNIRAVDAFLKKHRAEFIGFDDLRLSGVGKKGFYDRVLSFLYFTLRKIKNVK